MKNELANRQNMHLAVLSLLAKETADLEAIVANPAEPTPPAP